MKTFNVGDRVFFFVDGRVLERKIQVKKESLDGWDHKTIHITFEMLSDQNCLNPTRYIRGVNEIFETKDDALSWFIDKA